MHIRPAQPTDHPGIEALLNAAFGGPAEARLVAALRDAGDAVIEYVAVEDGEVLGQVMLSRLAAPPGWLALAPLAVRPDRQRRGIGAALTREALAAARSGAAWANVVVLGDPAYYGRFGFSMPAGRGVHTPYAREFTGVLSVGGAASDEAARLVYPPAFAEV